MLMVVRVGREGIRAVLRDAGMSDDEFRRVNGFSVDRAHIGMACIVDFVDDIEYVVKPFDTIESIARRYNVRANYIREYNHIDNVFLGDRIYIERTALHNTNNQ